MEHIFVGIYRFFSARRTAFWMTFLLILTVLGWGSSRIILEENITRIFPNDERVQKLNYVFRNSAFAERVVVMVSVRDSATMLPPDSLIAVTERVSGEMDTVLTPFQATVTTKVDDASFVRIFDAIVDNLPLFLTEHDYRELDSLTRPETVRNVLRDRYFQLVSPSGFAFKRVIMDDPMGFSFIVLKKLQQLQYDENFLLYNGYILTKDRRHLVFFVQPGYGSNETGKNTDFINALDQIAAGSSSDAVLVSYFGAAAVAVGNSQQLRQDTILTVSLLVILLGVFIIGYFRDVRVLVLILVPVIFGGLFALCAIYLLKGSLSVLAVAAGSVILGIAVNYALHFFVHFRYNPDKEAVIRDLVKPMTIGSATTVLAFFCLQFTNALVLKDVGLFAGFSLIGAALCSLIFLPQLAPDFQRRAAAFPEQRFSGVKLRKFWVAALVVITPVMFYFAGDVKFNSDMNDLNFMSDVMRESQQRLETINPASLHSMYVTTEGATREEALRRNEQVAPRIDSLLQKGRVRRFHSPSLLLASDSLQRVRIDTWNAFWSAERTTALLETVNEEGARLKFSPVLLGRVQKLLEKPYEVMGKNTFDTLKAILFSDNFVQRETRTTIVSLVNVLPEAREEVQDAVAGTQADIMDRGMITNLFVEFVHDDFNFIVTFTSVLVFVVLLISLGRIELTLITFAPMLITWVWILGIMALLNIEFNIVNVMISTFIFGLGDDYSIFVMDGLTQQHRLGRQTLKPVRVSILLSALTTVSGLGVLIFAEHPALRSIAAIAIIGILCVFIMSLTVEPLLFSWLVTRRTRKGLEPMAARGIVYTMATYGLFVLGSFLLTIVGLMLRSVPFARKKLRGLFHWLIRLFTRLVLWLAFLLRKHISTEGSDIFKRPGIIIANHSSFLDILITTMLHPRVVLLTTKWVWNSPVFGGVVRLADYYPVVDGVEAGVEKFAERVAEGFSIVVFPEGSRSPDGTIRRFHKGAFYLAETLRLPVYPLLIHGAAAAIPKSTMYVSDGTLHIRALPAIEFDDPRYGNSYAERTKRISRYFREEYNKLHEEVQTPASYRKKLIGVYRYKGPVLEWYLRIKLRMEKYYAVFDSLVPRRAIVLDLGCGYGFLPYMLQFMSTERTITGVDYDEEKILVARHGYARSRQLDFVHADIRSFPFHTTYDVIILADVMHYLLPAEQDNVLLRCFAALNPGGRIILRDGDADLRQRHKKTKFTEFMSTRVFRFNKTRHELNFLSGRKLEEFSALHGYSLARIDPGDVTSNVIFVISR